MLSIRRAAAADAAKICSCTVNAFKDYMVMIGRTPGPMLEDYWVAIHEHHVFVAEVNGRFSGFSLIKDGDDDCMWLDVLAVEVEYEGQGIGTALLKHAESFIISKGKKKCRLYTHVKYERAQELYLRHGYEIYQRVQEDGFDRYYLEKQLDGKTVCDECHTSGMDEIISICLKSESANPVEIMEQMMSIPACHMHGPEHHTMVGSALLTAYKNAGGDIDLKSALYEMQVRGKQVPGGACSLWGACGAGVSTGMYVSIALKTTPLSEKTWGLSNQMTARALSAIGKNGGPRCCKRDSYLAIIEAVKFTSEHLGVDMDMAEIKCLRSHMNNQCLYEDCKFFGGSGKGKPKVAFVCVHNSCRSQIAEALGKKLASDVFESYSAGTEIKDHINPDAVRIMKQMHGIDMEENQYNKLIDDIPTPDVVVTMGCNVVCPYIPGASTEDWGLDDPTGKPDDEFERTIQVIEKNILRLREELL